VSRPTCNALMNFPPLCEWLHARTNSDKKKGALGVLDPARWNGLPVSRPDCKCGYMGRVGKAACRDTASGSLQILFGQRRQVGGGRGLKSVPRVFSEQKKFLSIRLNEACQNKIPSQRHLVTPGWPAKGAKMGKSKLATS
jgi:hypothetical protein